MPQARNGCYCGTSIKVTTLPVSEHCKDWKGHNSYFVLVPYIIILQPDIIQKYWLHLVKLLLVLVVVVVLDTLEFLTLIPAFQTTRVVTVRWHFPRSQVTDHWVPISCKLYRNDTHLNTGNSESISIWA